jgi:hypothetical protein
MLARGLYAELVRRLHAVGEEIAWDGSSSVDRSMLVEAGRRLRDHTEHPEWAPAAAPVKRRLFLPGRFARGS